MEEENEIKITLIKKKIWCNSSKKEYSYFVKIEEKNLCLHCVLEGYCDKKLGFQKQ